MDPARLVAALGLDEGARRTARGVTIRCPAHDDHDPSCSVTLADDSRGIRIRCHACNFTADALGLIAHVYGLATRGPDFREVLRIAANLGVDTPPQRHRPPPTPKPPKYPPASEVRRLWHAGGSPDETGAARDYLDNRGIDPAIPNARCIHGLELPRWARYQRRTWDQLGHWIIVPTVDAAGRWQSLRAMRVLESESPKRLPPAGYTAAGLIMANRPAIDMLRGLTAPKALVIVEGEPDWLTWCDRRPELGVIGILSGAWTPKHGRRVPVGLPVSLRLHHDEAGERYAQQIIPTLAHAEVLRA